MAIGNLVANLTANTHGFTQPLHRAQSMLGGFASSVTGTLGRIGLAFQGLQALRSIGGAVTGMVKTAGAAEQAEVAFTTLLGSADKARSHLQQLQAFSASTPFQFTELIDASRRLQALGFDSKQVVPVLRIVGDAVGSLGLGSEGIDRVTLALGQMRSKGKVSAQEVNQLAEAGIPAWEMMASAIGITVPQAMKRAESGGISAATGINAILAGMESRFAGGMKAQSGTILGIWSNIQDAIGFISTDIGKALIEGFNLKALASDTAGFLNTFRSDWLPGITTVINTVGQAFGRVVSFMQSGWGAWIGQSIAQVVDFYANFDLYFQLAQQSIVLWAANNINRVSTFFTNIGEWLSWFMANWKSVFTTAGDFLVTVLTNAAKNFSSLFTAVFDFAKGKGFNFKATNITEGFQSSIAELPKLTEAAIADTTPELDALFKELGERQAAAAAKAIAPPVAETTPEAAFDPLKDTGAKTGKQAKVDTAAAAIGSKEAMSTIARTVNQSRDPAVKAAEKQLTETKKQTTLMAEIRDSVRDQVKLEVADIAS